MLMKKSNRGFVSNQEEVTLKINDPRDVIHVHLILQVSGKFDQNWTTCADDKSNGSFFSEIKGM